MSNTDLRLGELQDIADLEFESAEMNDCVVTIEGWLRELLCRVWIEKDDFSGKAAFGNSGWEYDIYRVLIKEEIVHGEIDEYNDVTITESNRNFADNIVLDIILELM